MRLLTYQMPDELLAIASQGEFDEFDLNAFFAATGTAANAEFSTRATCRSGWTSSGGSYSPTQVDNLKLGSHGHRSRIRTSGCWNTSDTRSGSWPNVAACHAMANLWLRVTTPSGTTTTC